MDGIAQDRRNGAVNRPGRTGPRRIDSIVEMLDRSPPMREFSALFGPLKEKDNDQ